MNRYSVLKLKRRNADLVKFAKRHRTANMRSQRLAALPVRRVLQSEANGRAHNALGVSKAASLAFSSCSSLCAAPHLATRRSAALVLMCPPVAPLRTTYILQKRILPACVNPQCLRTFSVHTYVHTYFLRFEINSRSASGPAHLSMYLVHRRSTRARGARHTDSITEAVHLSKGRKTPSKDVKRQN